MTRPRPVWRTALRLVAENRRLRRDNDRLLDALELANNSTDEAIRIADGWQSRAELLYALAGPSADMFLRDMSRIEHLPERTEP